MELVPVFFLNIFAQLGHLRVVLSTKFHTSDVILPSCVSSLSFSLSSSFSSLFSSSSSLFSFSVLFSSLVSLLISSSSISYSLSLSLLAAPLSDAIPLSDPHIFCLFLKSFKKKCIIEFFDVQVKKKNARYFY